MRDREQERNERREYDADVFYEVWRSGRNPDRINDDRVSDHYYDGDSSEQAASHEIRLQREAEQRRRDEQEQREQQEYEDRERQYYEDQERFFQ